MTDQNKPILPTWATGQNYKYTVRLPGVCQDSRLNPPVQQPATKWMVPFTSDPRLHGFMISAWLDHSTFSQGSRLIAAIATCQDRTPGIVSSGTNQGWLSCLFTAGLVTCLGQPVNTLLHDMAGQTDPCLPARSQRMKLYVYWNCKNTTQLNQKQIKHFILYLSVLILHLPCSPFHYRLSDVLQLCHPDKSHVLS